MSKVREFIDYWIKNSVHAAEQYGTPGASQRASELAERCVEMAASQGLSRADLESEVGNLEDYIGAELERANQDEKARADGNRRDY
jgi:hypothetical protein